MYIYYCKLSVCKPRSSSVLIICDLHSKCVIIFLSSPVNVYHVIFQSCKCVLILLCSPENVSVLCYYVVTYSKCVIILLCCPVSVLSFYRIQHRIQPHFCSHQNETL
jgi:hypothetical protein